MSSSSMQQYLDMIASLAQSNPEFSINERFLYAQLVSFNLGTGIVPFENVERYFRNWITTFQENATIDVYRDKKNPFVCHFSSKQDCKPLIKLYIPLDANHIKEGVTQLFSFLSKENILHDSKVLSSVRNDNVIVKVSSIEDANKIVKYLKHHSELTDGLLNMNPFLVPCYKIGVSVVDKHIYNLEVCRVLANIVEDLKKANELTRLTTIYLKNTFEKLSVIESDEVLCDLYRLATIALDEDSTLQDFANYIIERQEIGYVSKHAESENLELASKEYFNEAITETFTRYNNLSFVINAVRLYVTTGNVRGFTRNHKARQNLKLYTDIDVIKKLFDKQNLDLSIKLYILKVISKD